MSSLLLLDEELLEDELVVGTPVEGSSRDIPRVNAAFKSSRRRITSVEGRMSGGVRAGAHLGHSSNTNTNANKTPTSTVHYPSTS